MSKRDQTALTPPQEHCALHGGDDGTFGYAAEQLNRFGLAYLHLIEPRIKGNVLVEDDLPPVAAAQMRKIFQSKIIAAGGFEPDTAEAIVEKGDADLVAFGRHFIANPDLPKRITPASAQPLRSEDVLRRRRPRLYRLPILQRASCSLGEIYDNETQNPVFGTTGQVGGAVLPHCKISS